jgi:autotransporter-associated beta strand protein
LNLNNTVIRIKAGASLDPTQDYLLATVSGSLSGAVNPAPIWDVQPNNYSAFVPMVTNGNQIVLHALSLPPSLTSASVSPTVLGRNENLFISAAGAPGTYQISNLTANASSVGGASALVLVADGAGDYTNSVQISAAFAPSGGLPISITITDSNGISSGTNFTVSVIVTNRTWNGGSGSDNNWGSNPNWATGAGPGFVGDAVVFGGSTRLTPNMETNYSLTGLTFNNSAGSFTVGTSGKYLTLTGAGVTNNSVNQQTVNVPISLGAAQSFNAASGNLAFGQNITNNGNLLTVLGSSNTTISGVISGTGGLTKNGTGTVTLANVCSYSGLTAVNAGSVIFSGAGTSSLAGGFKVAGGLLQITAGTVNVPVAANSGNPSLTNGGNMTVSGGALNISSGANQAWFPIGDTSGQTSTLTISGGSIYVTNAYGTEVARQGSGTLTITSGGFTNADISNTGFIIGDQSTAQTGTVNLNGGVLAVNKIVSNNGTNSFNFDGGTLKPTGVNTSTFWVNSSKLAARVKENGGTINNNGVAIIIAQPLLHGGSNATDGGLIFAGNAKTTLTGGNTYTGDSVVTAGTLALTNSGALASSSIVISNGATFDVSGVGFTLGAGQTIKGGGTVRGATTINGTVSPGSSIGVLTFNTPPILNGTAVMEINRTNAVNADRLVVNGAFNYGGKLTVTNIGPAPQSGDSFTLFTATSYTGSFGTTNLPTLAPGLGWQFNASGNILTVVQTVATNSPPISFAASTGILTLSWPADHMGWRLQVQTNTITTGLGSNWFDVAGSSQTNSVLIPIDTDNDSVFYRLVYP